MSLSQAQLGKAENMAMDWGPKNTLNFSSVPGRTAYCQLRVFGVVTHPLFSVDMHNNVLDAFAKFEWFCKF